MNYVNHSEGECHINRASILRPWIAVYRGICKDNLTLYLAAFKTYRRLRKMKPLQAIKITIKIAIHIITATKIIVKSVYVYPNKFRKFFME